MKRLVLLSVLVLVVGAGNAMAQCIGTQVTGNNINVVLEGNLVCAEKPNASSNNDRWAEEHWPINQGQPGMLWEYAKGPSDTVDPRHEVGTWSRSGNDIIYNYGSGGTYTWSLYVDNSTTPPTYRFCDGSTVAVITKIITIPGTGTPGAQNPCTYPPQ